MATMRCIEAFAYNDKKTNAPRVVREGEVVDVKDPAVKGREVFFESTDETAARDARRAAGAPDHVDRATITKAV